MNKLEQIELKNNQELKVKLIISNIATEKLAYAAMMTLGDYHMARDKHMVMASYEECQQLVKQDMLKSSKYAFPRKGNYALIIDSDAFNYSSTVNKIRESYQDFLTGWRACQGKFI